MTGQEFEKLCIKTVKKYVNAHLDKTDDWSIRDVEIFVVWMCKTLQNNKALISTSLPDGMYYEITYNGDKKELYLDAYKKFDNVCIKV